MTDLQFTSPDVDEAPGWYVTDPDGNIVASGPVCVALPVSAAGETESDGEIE
jgi:hypothetical protein